MPHLIVSLGVSFTNEDLAIAAGRHFARHVAVADDNFVGIGT